jgi:hypothetical protein
MIYALGLLFLLAALFFFVFGSRLYGQPRVKDRVGHWHHTFPDLDTQPDTIYTGVYQALRSSLQERDVALYGLGFGPTRFFARASLLAERPLYLHVRYRHLSYYLYAGQTPAGLFVSSWFYDKYLLGEQRLLAPTKKAWRYFSKQTLFEHDAALMFVLSVHELVTGLLNEQLVEKGLQPMEELERRPILHAFYQHPFAHDPYFLDGGRVGGYSGASVNGSATPGAPSPVLHPAPLQPVSQATPQTPSQTAAAPHPDSTQPDSDQPNPSQLSSMPITPPAPVPLFDLEAPDGLINGPLSDKVEANSTADKSGRTDTGGHAAEAVSSAMDSAPVGETR